MLGHVQVPVTEVLEVTVWDADPLSNDTCLGVVEIDIAEDVAKAPGGRIYKTWYLQVRASSGGTPSLCLSLFTLLGGAMIVAA